MTLTKFEQSGFILETENGFRLAFDIGNKTPSEKLEGVKPVDLFVVSHIHGDHFLPVHISALDPKTIILPKECYEILCPNELLLTPNLNIIHDQTSRKIKADYVLSAEGLVYENENIKITFFHVDHGRNISMPVDNYGFIIEADGQKIYFAGDMFYPSGVTTSEIEVDYALIPVGTFYTFGPQEALDFIKTFKKIGTVIPMHYENKPETKDEFIALAKDWFLIKEN